MSVNTYSTTRVAYLTSDEAAYAAGKGAATKYLATAMEAGDQASLTGMNYPAGACKLGIPEVNRKKIKAIGQTANSIILFSQGYKTKEFTYTQYVQTDKWIKEAIAVATGAIPASHLFHLEIPCITALGVHGMDYFDLVGCVLQKYELDTSADDFPKETLTFYYYDIVDSVAVTTCPNFVSTQPSTHKDVSITFDTDAIIAETMKLTIENDLLDTKGTSKYQRLDPYMKARNIECDIETRSDLSGQPLKTIPVGGTLTAVSLATLVVAIASIETLTVTNMYNDSTNIDEIPEEQDVKTWKLALRMGGACAVSSA